MFFGGVSSSSSSSPSSRFLFFFLCRRRRRRHLVKLSFQRTLPSFPLHERSIPNRVFHFRQFLCVLFRIEPFRRLHELACFFNTLRNCLFLPPSPLFVFQNFSFIVGGFPGSRERFRDNLRIFPPLCFFFFFQPFRSSSSSASLYFFSNYFFPPSFICRFKLTSLGGIRSSSSAIVCLFSFCRGRTLCLSFSLSLLVL